MGGTRSGLMPLGLMCFLVCSAQVVLAHIDAVRVSLSQLFLSSDVVVIARIEGISDRSFLLDNRPKVDTVVSARVSYQYKGRNLSDIEFFQDAHGHAHYVPGDLAVLFLNTLGDGHPLHGVGSAAGVDFVSSQASNTAHRINPGELADYQWVLAAYAESANLIGSSNEQRLQRVKQTMLRMLGSNSKEITESALLDWENMGGELQLDQEEIAYLLALTRDPASPVNLRVAILHSMSRKQLVDETAWIYLFEHEVNENLLRVIMSTHGIENRAFMPYIVAQLDNSSDEVVEGAARALGHPAYKGAEAALKPLLHEENQRLNYAAVYALAGINSAQARQILLDAEADHPNPKVRRLISARLKVFS